MFPMVLPFFFFTVVGWEVFKEKFQLKNWMTKAFGYCVALNLVVMVFWILTPAKEMAAYNKFVWNWTKQHPESTLYYVKKEPLKKYPLDMPFYLYPQQKQAAWYTDPTLKNDTSALKHGDLMLITDTISPAAVAPPGFRLKKAYAYYPDWILDNNTNDWQERTRIWTIYKLEKAE